MIPPRPSFRTGFSLVEVALALGLAAFCLIAILGMIPVGLNSSQNANAETGAASVLTAVGADLRDTPLKASQSPFFNFPVSNTVTQSMTIYMDEGGNFNSSLAALPAARYRVTVTTQAAPAAAALPLYATAEQVTVTWPAQAAPANASGSLSSLIALSRN